MVYQASAIMMTCPDSTFEKVQCLPESLISKVGNIQNDIQAIHLPEQLKTRFSQRSCHSCTVGIAAWAIVSRTKSPKAIGVGFFKIRQVDQRVRSLQAQNITYRFL